MVSARRDRPQMPDGYGVPETDDGMLAWADIEARLVAAPQYWMATTRADGRPHVVPRWGVAWEGEGAGGLMTFVPAKAMAWFDFPTDVTRFRFT